MSIIRVRRPMIFITVLSSKPASGRDALDIRQQVTDGLGAAHEQNLIHRDIRPANILIDAKGRPAAL